MNNQLTVFNYECNKVRNVVIKGEPWFVLADICKILELSNPTMVAKKLDKDERAKSDLGLQERNVTLINESGLYAVILRSDKPQAKPFRKWVTSEVLPTIRKTGKYESKSADDYKVRNLAVKEMNARSRQAQTLVRLAHLTQNVTCKEAMIAQAANTVSGKELLPLPQLLGRTYTAEEIGIKLGITKNKVGRLTNAYNLKTEQYGGWFADFIEGVGEKQTFRYYESVVPVLQSLIGSEVAV